VAAPTDAEIAAAKQRHDDANAAFVEAKLAVRADPDNIQKQIDFESATNVMRRYRREWRENSREHWADRLEAGSVVSGSEEVR